MQHSSEIKSGRDPMTRKTGGGRRKNRSGRRERRREEAAARAAVHAERSPGERLALLVGRGHEKCNEAVLLRAELRRER